MTSLSCRCTLFFVLSTSIPAFAAPLQENSPLELLSTGTYSSSSLRGASDGYQRSYAAFKLYEKKGGELRALLSKIQAEVEVGRPGDSVQQQAQFRRRLDELYPGSTYDGGTGTLLLQKNFSAKFNRDLTVESFRESGLFTITILPGQGQITLSDGVSSVTVLIDRINPSLSTFSKAAIPAIKEDAERILSVPGYRRTASDSVETAILNDAYKLLSQSNPLRMDQFAAQIMHDSVWQQKALGIARREYFGRHFRDYQNESIQGKPESPAPSRPLQGSAKLALRLLLLGVLLAATYWLAVKGSRLIQSLFLDRTGKLRLQRFNSLSPMVKRSLHKLGTSLWGRNLPWRHNYSILTRNERWLLCEGNRGRSSAASTEMNRIEVSMRGSNFKLRITCLNGVAVDKTVACKDFSKEELTRRLSEIRAIVVEAASRTTL